MSLNNVGYFMGGKCHNLDANISECKTEWVSHILIRINVNKILGVSSFMDANACLIKIIATSLMHINLNIKSLKQVQ